MRLLIDMNVLTQVLAYMGTISQDKKSTVRGILVAQDFHQRVIFAARTVPDIQLKQYSFRFLFGDR
jgi:RecB family endonuclease NucS